MTNETLCPINIDEIRRLSPIEKAEALKKYHEWVRGARKQDRRLEHNKDVRKYNFKTRKTRNANQKLAIFKKNGHKFYNKKINSSGLIINVQTIVRFDGTIDHKMKVYTYRTQV